MTTKAKKKRRVREKVLSPVIQTEYERVHILMDPAIPLSCSAIWDGKPCGQVIEAGAQHRYRMDSFGRAFPVCMDCVYRESGDVVPWTPRVRIGLMPGGL